MTTDVRFMSPEGQQTPAQEFVKITASATEFDTPTRAIYVDTAGTADWTDIAGNASTSVNLVAGSIIPVQLIKVTALSSAVIYAMR